MLPDLRCLDQTEANSYQSECSYYCGTALLSASHNTLPIMHLSRLPQYVHDITGEHQ